MARGDFAIIGEGITDQILLKQVLLGYCSDWDDDPEIVFEQPPGDATATARELAKARQAGTAPPGGWTLVQRYFAQRKYLQALQSNRYLVVQIDTDVAHDYGVSRVADGQTRNDAELVAAVIAEIRSWIDPAVQEAHGHRFLFAIGVDAIECWLLGLVFDASQRAKRKKTTGCLKAINAQRKKQNQMPLSDADGARKDPGVYGEIARGFQDGALLRRLAVMNPGLAAFVDQLDAAAISPIQAG